MRRREFITFVACAATWPLWARAQQAAMPMLGILNGASFNEQFYAPMVAQFLLGLKELGFVEGQNITIVYRAANGHPERLPELAADLVQRQAAVILAIGGSNTALVAKAATSKDGSASRAQGGR
jgi:putative ABC transport system substrate-binding protein